MGVCQTSAFCIVWRKLEEMFFDPPRNQNNNDIPVVVEEMFFDPPPYQNNNDIPVVVEERGSKNISSTTTGMSLLFWFGGGSKNISSTTTGMSYFEVHVIYR
jgi:hypothetical protein